MSETIIIDIDPTGNTVKVEGKGIKGPDCLTLTADIEKSLGEVESRRKTAEFTAPRAATRTQTA